MIINVGSINVDHVYQVKAIPQPGETLTVNHYQQFLGGKGANQSIAAVRAGAQVVHLGAIGDDGDWALAQLQRAGVDTQAITRVDGPTGHAAITVDNTGENQILIVPGANRRLTLDALTNTLDTASDRGWLMLQNETNHVQEAASLARAKGWQVAYSAAPFVTDDARAVLPFVDLLLLNEGERLALEATLDVNAIPCPMILTTLGARGAVLETPGERHEQIAFKVQPVDTTGAGDTFAGAMVARLTCGDPLTDALRFAAAASAIQVTRPGASGAIPTADEVYQLMQDQS